MIGQLRGKLLEKQPPQLMIDVNGVGYICSAPLSTFFGLPEIGKEITLFTHMVVREDAHLLFAFSSKQESHLFQEIIKISGIGPKVALAILSGLNVEEFFNCVANQEVRRLQAIPGIGAKTAERLILDLKDKLVKLKLSSFNQISLTTKLPEDSEVEQAIQALIALGYKPAEATKAVSKVSDKTASCEKIIKEALQGLSKL